MGAELLLICPFAVYGPKKRADRAPVEGVVDNMTDW